MYSNMNIRLFNMFFSNNVFILQHFQVSLKIVPVKKYICQI